MDSRVTRNGKKIRAAIKAGLITLTRIIVMNVHSSYVGTVVAGMIAVVVGMVISNTFLMKVVKAIMRAETS